MSLTTPFTKKKSIYLSNKDKWEVAKFCIENGCVRQNNGKLFNHWRVAPKVAAQEINEWLRKDNVSIPPVNEYHTKSSMDFYNEVCILTDNLPEVPKQESVMEEMLKIEITKLNDKITKLQETSKDFEKTIIVIKGRFDQIKKLASI